MACMIGQFHSLPLTLLLPYLSSQYNKNYDTDDEYQKRLETFMKNVIFIDNFSKEKHSYECAWMVIRACLLVFTREGSGRTFSSLLPNLNSSVRNYTH